MCWVCKYVGFKLKVFLLPHCAGERDGGFLVLILQGRILVGLVLSNSRYASVQVASSFIPCLHLLIYVEETQSITLGQKLFLLWVLNVNLGMSLALRKVPFKLRVPEWLLFASSVWRDVISAVPAICHLFCCCSGLPRTSSFSCSFYYLRDVFAGRMSDVTSFVSESVEQNRSGRGAGV